MNTFEKLESDLQQLGRDLAGPADFSRQVMATLNAELASRADLAPAQTPRQLRKKWHVPAILAASVMLCIGIWWLSRPANVYARMLAALAEARTVHTTGWTRVILRKWPLESAPENDLSAEWPDGKVPIEMWHWTDADGAGHSYEKSGPVTRIRHGGDMKEYQEDADLTYIYEGGFNKDRVAKFSGQAQFLSLLERPSLTKEKLGARQEGDRSVRGLRLTQGNRVEEIWFDDETALPVRLVRQDRNSGQTMLELFFHINKPVPAVIANFTPPATKHVRYGGGNRTNEAWIAHVAALGERLQLQPPANGIALVPRDDGQLFASQYEMLTPNGKYWVRPLDVDQYNPMSLEAFIRFHATTNDDERRMGTWRIPRELHDLEFPRADLVHTADMPWQEWVQFALGELGLELVDQTEGRTLWVARHDGQPLKQWQDVKPPVPYVVEGGKEQKGYVKPGIGFMLRPATLEDLFNSFNENIDRYDFAADKPWIIDGTNLPAPPPYNEAEHGTYREYSDEVMSQYLVATDAPWFVGEESLKLARDWFAKEFGITFVEISRPVTVHAIRRKQ